MILNPSLVTNSGVSAASRIDGSVSVGVTAFSFERRSIVALVSFSFSDGSSLVAIRDLWTSASSPISLSGVSPIGWAPLLESFSVASLIGMDFTRLGFAPESDDSVFT